VKASEFEARMRAGECFHSLRVPPGAYIVVRVDGRSFSRFTETHCQKPFDSEFNGWMVLAAKALLTELHARYVYTESDEISALLPRESELFDREVEKLTSIAAATASATFALASGRFVQFDGRIWVGARDADVVDYFRWRQDDATRCALNGWCYWTLRKLGRRAHEATAALLGASTAEKNELLHTNGVNFNDVPAWQRRGVGVHWERWVKDGFNPKTGATVKAVRRRVRVDDDLPMKADYARFVRGIVRAAPDEVDA